MRIEASPSANGIGFIVYAENQTERALLTQFTNSNIMSTHQLGIGGHTYECDYSAVTSFTFGWFKPPKIKVRKQNRKTKGVKK